MRFVTTRQVSHPPTRPVSGGLVIDEHLALALPVARNL
jgi:hypothetical protein